MLKSLPFAFCRRKVMHRERQSPPVRPCDACHEEQITQGTQTHLYALPCWKQTNPTTEVHSHPSAQAALPQPGAAPARISHETALDMQPQLCHLSHSKICLQFNSSHHSEVQEGQKHTEFHFLGGFINERHPEQLLEEVGTEQTSLHASRTIQKINR